SVYSELFFLDLNWGHIRKIDLIRAFRDYQSRNRRFGA
ncbi:MAG: undecaprenyl diphosphate synthase family protein, partial [Methanospirillum sp.]|nr:undecaprenyl diphosphate synthase family protein [Methanospirillum sp.]